jgi:hypothetical protein
MSFGIVVGTFSSIYVAPPLLLLLARALGFAVGNYFTVLRLAWFPLLVVAVVQYFAAQAALEVGVHRREVALDLCDHLRRVR